MLKGILNLAPGLIRTKFLNFEGDELTTVDCIWPTTLFCNTGRQVIGMVKKNRKIGICVARK